LHGAIFQGKPMNHFSIDLPSSQPTYRPGDRVINDDKHAASGARGGFGRSVWPFLVNARRDPEGQLASAEKDQSGFSS
jgi:hypothetical protein